MIRDARLEDAEALAGIYNPYVLKTTVTFEETAVTAAEMAARLREGAGAYPWLVWEEGGELRGYACAHRFAPRASYRYAAEDSIYVREDSRGRGIGRALLEALLTGLETRPLHLVVAVLAIPNDPSVALHEALGFTPAGRLSEAGYKLGRWVDVGYWERRLSPGILIP